MLEKVVTLAILAVVGACDHPPQPHTPSSTGADCATTTSVLLKNMQAMRGTSASENDENPPGPRDNRDTKLEVTGIDPEKGDVEGGTYVRIIGNRFTADGPRAVKVYFGSQPGEVVRFASDREIIVQAPGGKPNEAVDVLIIFQPGGQLKIPNGFTFVEKR